MAISLKEPWEIEIMRDAGNIIKVIFREIADYLKEGLTTQQVDSVIRDIIVSHNAKPTFLNYRGFPANSCISINNEIVHGIPSKDVYIKEGDMVKIDVGATYKGYIADAARTFTIGKIPDVGEKLIDVCWRALQIGIESAVPGNKLGEIGKNIEEYVVSEGFNVVKEYVGHGVGKTLHEDPQVPNFALDPTSYYYNYQLKPGLCICIEPMVNEGSSATTVLDDKWTVVTADGKLSAHFEDTMAITENGVELLTR